MNSITDIFTYSTAEEQKNSFSGEVQENSYLEFNEDILHPGDYRIIDGNLCRIISGVSPELIRTYFNSIAKQDND